MELNLGKLLRGGTTTRRSRFHDGNDRFIGWGELRHLPHAAGTWILRRGFGRLPGLPWWPYATITRIEKVLRPDSIVLEFGTGTSTLWMAARASQVYSVEDNPEWAARVRSLARQKGLTNIQVILRNSKDYPDSGSHSAAFNDAFSSLEGIPEPEFDLVVVDGAVRWRCVERALPRVKRGGYLYLDNTDGEMDWDHYLEAGCSRLAQRLVEEAVHRGEGTLEAFRGLCPATLFAVEGWLFRRKGSAGQRGLPPPEEPGSRR